MLKNDTNKKLKFVAKNSKNANTTKNIYIESDNLEVLTNIGIELIYIQVYI